MNNKIYYSAIASGIANGNEMPSLPQIIIKVQRATMKDDTSVQELATLILEDLSLTGKVLKLANSAYYRRSAQNVSTVTQAIILLGFGEIQKMVTAISVYEFFSLMTNRNSFRDIWKHSICVGLCAHRIALAMELELAESYLVGGLLHDIGKFVMGQYYPDEYEDVIKKVRETGCKYEDVERVIFGCTHHEIGVLIGNQWNLPEDVCRTINDHDFVSKLDLKSKNNMTRIISLSDLIANKTCGFESEQKQVKIASVLNIAEEVLHIKQDVLMAIISHLNEEIYGIARMLDISIDNLKIDLQADETVFGEDDLEGTKILEPPETAKRSREDELLEVSLKVQDIAMTPELDVGGVCHKILAELKHLFRLKFAGVFIKNENGQISPISFQGHDSDKVVPKLIFNATHKTILSYAIEQNKATILDAELHRQLPSNSLLTNALGSSKIAAFPLVFGKKVFGAVMLVKDQHDENLSTLEKRVIISCVYFLAMAYEAKKK